MADNYLLFSESIPGLNPEEQDWVRRLLSTDRPHDLAEMGIRADVIDIEDWPGFQWEVQQPSNDLWLYAEESGNVMHVGEFVRAFLARSRPAACCHLSWAETCSRPRLGEFGGGGLFVTASSVQSWSAHEWLAQQRARFQENPCQASPLNTGSPCCRSDEQNKNLSR